MTHSRTPSSLVAVALVCCCGALPCRVAALEHPSPPAVANASLSTETVVVPPLPAATQRSAPEPVEQSLIRGGETHGRGRELAAARPWYLSPLSALAVVVGLILVAAWLAKRFLPGMRRNDERGPLQVLATTYLSPKQSIALVRCGQRMILIGVTPEHISSLAVMDDTNDLPSLARVSDRSDGRRLSGQFNEVLDEAGKDFDRNDAVWDEPLGPDEREIASARQEIRGLLDRVRSLAGGRL